MFVPKGYIHLLRPKYSMIPTEKKQIFLSSDDLSLFLAYQGLFCLFCQGLSYRGLFQASSADSLCASCLGDETGQDVACEYSRLS